MISVDGHTDAYWNGYTTMMMALALKAPDQKETTRILRRTLSEFLDSPLPSEELKQMLREEMR